MARYIRGIGMIVLCQWPSNLRSTPTTFGVGNRRLKAVDGIGY